MRVAVLLALVAAALAIPAVGQPASDKARVDEFAVSAGNTDTAVEQVEPASRAKLAEAPAPTDRELGVPSPRAARGPIDQLSRTGERTGPAQLASPAKSRQVVTRSVSSTRDSRPQASAALGGRDKCAPGGQAERSGECARIIERRAGEYTAAEAPRLSAEQEISARLQSEEAATAARMRSRMAGTNATDADLVANQELAAIYIRNSAPEPGPQMPQDPAVAAAGDPSALAQMLDSLQAGAVVLTPGSGK